MIDNQGFQMGGYPNYIGRLNVMYAHPQLLPLRQFGSLLFFMQNLRITHTVKTLKASKLEVSNIWR